jgi:hypothetical protein
MPAAHRRGQAINAAHNLATADLSGAVQKALADLLPAMQKLNDQQDPDAKTSKRSSITRPIW